MDEGLSFKILLQKLLVHSYMYMLLLFVHVHVIAICTCTCYCYSYILLLFVHVIAIVIAIEHFMEFIMLLSVYSSNLIAGVLFI